MNSVDPAPPYFDVSVKQAKQPKSYEELEKILLDEKQSLFERYRAMFTLRDLDTNTAVDILCKGFKNDKSALFKHEIAFVLGQMLNEHAVNSLIGVLRDNSEHEMVRHEAAEALGAIAKDQVLPILNEYKEDEQTVVKESCQVALDMHEYWNSEEVDNVFE
ncbi:hypothetical protein RFI_21599 [Reticulomyxa filosa]|uniref:deoxyhypusine monooxygenase n=1 Tax=Reticulomyxa filosa TaxID=46433 RepID=X6MP33_RETFI|nr:hypothetical protein RFI_33310 [Reticulomyxa filosa]ETO15763.1 hypothetical protein RFI_21599 [Reticulomyxa filosa]|eukprot:ETO04092.1 hypothetical protein RFI_33310 [Reticulomyxa filosa]